jgi:signal transduction histidine kinase
VTNRGDHPVNRFAPAARAIVLLAIAAIVVLAGAVTIAGVALGLGGRDLLEVAEWLAIGAALSLLVGIFLVWVVDRAADGRYATRLAISGVLAAVVLAGSAWPAFWKLIHAESDRSLLWLTIGFATAIAALFAVYAGWIDSRPLSTTAADVLDIARGNYRARLPESGNTEIMEIATATNLLASRAQSSALRQSNQDRARESLLLAIAADAQIPIDNLRAIIESMGATGSADPAIMRRYLDALSRETGALQRRLDEVEEIARLETGQVTLRMVPVSLAQLIIAVCDRLQPGAATRNVIVGPRVDFSAPRILADPDQTLRALEALISYALSETPDDGQLVVEMRDAGQFVQLAAIELPGEEEPNTAERIRWESAHRRRESALSLAVAGRLIEIQGGSFLISHGNPGAPIVVVSLPRS